MIMSINYPKVKQMQITDYDRIYFIDEYSDISPEYKDSIMRILHNNLKAMEDRYLKNCRFKKV